MKPQRPFICSFFNSKTHAWGELMNVERKKWYHKLLRPLLNAIGTLEGMSGCGICGDKWNWKMSHNVMLSSREGAFPTCEECWQTRGVNEIVRAAHHLAAMWVSQSYTNLDKQEAKANAMVEAVRIAACCREAGVPIANLPMKVSELKYTMNLHYIQCSCGATWERACDPRERRKFFEEHKDHNVKRFHVTSTVSKT